MMKQNLGTYLKRYYQDYTVTGKSISLRFVREDHYRRLIRSGWELSFE